MQNYFNKSSDLFNKIMIIFNLLIKLENYYKIKKVAITLNYKYILLYILYKLKNLSNINMTPSDENKI